MASLSAGEAEAVREAVAKMRRDEPFEKSLGRALRGHGFSYNDYVRIISAIRETAQGRKIGITDAALAVSERPE